MTVAGTLDSLTLSSGQFTSLLHSLFTLPTIGLPVSNSDSNASIVVSKLAKWGILRGIPIGANKCVCKGGVQLGSQIVLRSNAKGNDMVTDNATPMPRQWTLEGYLMTKLLTPGVQQLSPILNATVNKMVLPTMIKFVKEYFEYLRKSRAPFYFSTLDSDVVPVLMEDYEFEDVSEVTNTTRVKLSLKEFIVLEIGSEGTEVSNTPKKGSIFGDSSRLGSFAGNVLARSNLSIMKALL